MQRTSVTPTIQTDYIFINVEDIRPGMVLAEAVYDEHGHFLIPAGVMLRKQYQRQLRRRGVRTIAIDRRSASSALIQRQSLGATVTDAALYTQAQLDPFMQELANLIQARQQK